MLECRGLKRLLGCADSDFVHDVTEDIRCFTRHKRTDCVLVFPPFSNYRRFLIHKTAEDFKEDGVVTFSIGQGDDRRTVVCYGHQIIGNIGNREEKMVAESQKNEPTKVGGSGGDNPDWYCPPSGRMQTPQRQQRDVAGKTRRPDRAVYVPKARRTAAGSSATSDDNPEPKPTSPKAKRPSNRSYKDVYVPPRARSVNQPSPDAPSKPHRQHADCEASDPVQDNVPNSESPPIDIESIDSASLESPAVVCDNLEISGVSDSEIRENVVDRAPVVAPDIERSDNVAVDPPEHVNGPVPDVEAESNPSHNYSYTNSPVIIDDMETWTDKKDEDVEQKEFIKASENINRSNRRIIKQNFVSDVLIISEPESDAKSPTELENNKRNDDHESKSAAYNPEVEEWEAMFDDNGDLLEPKLVEELTAAVGKVTVQKPSGKYQSNSLLAFSHVLEVYNFPSAFSTNDLHSVFADFKHTGFEIKWVDDNHALIVFSTADIANRVLAMNLPMVKTRPLTEATNESRNKAKKAAEFLQPYRPRPETCPAHVKRVVKGALGVKLNVEERMQEHQQLSIAREKKRLAAQHREAAWNGSLANNV